MNDQRSGPRSSPIPFGAVLSLLIAVGLVFAFYRLPSMREWWPQPFYPLFWSGVGALVLFAMARIAFDYVPPSWVRSWSSLNRHRVSIPKEGIGYLLIMIVLFVGSSLTQSNMLLLVFAAMAGPFVVNGWVTFTMLKGIAVARKPPPRVMAGELFSVEIELKNQTPLVAAWMMTAQDAISGRGQTVQSSALFTRVPSGATVTGHYQLRIVERGSYEFGPLQVLSRFPLGLIERGVVWHQRSQVLVYPRVGRLSPQWKRRLVGASELMETPAARAGVFEDEFHHLREYRPGDNPRAIHWRSSARRNTLIVRDYHQNREHHLLLLIDLVLKEAGATGRETFENLLSLVATLCVEYRRECRGATITVILSGRETWRWEASSSQGSLDTLFDRLSLAEPVSENRFAATVTEALSQLSSTTRAVVISARAEAAVGNIVRARSGMTWLQVTPENYRQLVVFLDDPRSPVRRPEASNGLSEPRGADGLVRPVPVAP